MPLFSQKVAESHQIGWFILLEQFYHSLKNLSMALTVEILPGKDFQYLGEDLIVDQDSTQNRLLGFNILRRHFV
ncbi:MAG: hypothetical protein DRH10_07160 [Deltaproteobacteria bacterium]|nr:MAG: hypothetical protein DRH10_07160 [Deltaproteobacteria bacterium]